MRIVKTIKHIDSSQGPCWFASDGISIYFGTFESIGTQVVTKYTKFRGPKVARLFVMTLYKENNQKMRLCAKRVAGQ